MDFQVLGRSRGGLTTKIHAVVDTNGLPVQIGLTPGETHDNQLCSMLLSELRPQTMLLADRGYDADWIRAFASEQGACSSAGASQLDMTSLHLTISPSSSWHQSGYGCTLMSPRPS